MPPGETIRDWYNDTAPAPPTAVVTWEHIWSAWRAVELDFHTRFTADFGDGILSRRTWKWFESRVSDILSDNTSRTAKAVRPLVATNGGTRV